MKKCILPKSLNLGGSLQKILNHMLRRQFLKEIMLISKKLDVIQ